MAAVKEQSGVVEVKSLAVSYDDFGSPIKKESVASGSLAPKSADAETDLTNILNNYRSVNYHFTLAALTQYNVEYPQSYRNSALPYVIASTKGKGANAISDTIVPIKTTKDVIEYIPDEDGKLDSVVTKKVAGDDITVAKDIVPGFNKESPGRFEFFIDDLEIDSIVAPNQATGTSLSTQVRFEVFEQYSANGFIEALHVASLAAGWSGYLNAAFLLKIEFIGFPDNKDLPSAETIKSTKYIPIKFTGAEMSVTEQGTKYRCSAIPFNEAGYGNPNQIYTDISFTGNNVKQVLENLFDAVNTNLAEREKKEKNSDNTKNVRDIYEIYFPKLPGIGETLEITKTSGNAISSKKINDHLRENSLYKFPEIVKTQGHPSGGQADATSRLNPQSSRIQFPKNSQITEIITAVIRDSHYLKNILEDIKKAQDSNGMIDYFQIIINTIPLGADITTNVNKFKYQFLVVPYKVHYSKLPGQQSSSFPAKDLLPFVKRTYNYIYTGENLDVLNFKLNFNNLFFQAANPKMGNNSKNESIDAAGPSGNQTVKNAKDASEGAAKNVYDYAPIISDDDASSLAQRGGAMRTDPYFQLAYNAHQAILESVNLLTAEMDIIGDPYFLSTSGQSNYFSGIKQLGLTDDGEANPQFGPVLCKINFSNPVDIGANGQFEFTKLLPFSGIYQVIKVKHIFKDGAFKQNLKLIRFNGQISDPKEKIAKVNQPTQTAKPGEQSRTDSAPAEVPKQGVKENNVDLGAMINRGFPTAAGIQGPEASKLNQIAKAAFGVTAVLAGVDLLKGGLKADLGTLAGLTAVGSGAASLLNQAGSIAGSILPGNAASLLSSDTVKSVSETAGSIRTAASNLVAGVAPTTQEFLKTASGASITDGSGNPILVGAAALNPAGALSSVADKIGNITASSISGIGNIGGALSQAQKNAVIADATAKGIPVAQALNNASLFGVNLPGVVSNNGAIAAKLGIDPKMLSGLSGGAIDSKLIDQIKQAAEEIPKNTDLGKIKEQGIVMKNIAADAFKNLPAIPPALKAPLANVPSRSVASTLSAEQRAAVIADATAKGIPVDQALRNASLFGINIKGLSTEAQAIAISNNPQALAGNAQALAALGLSAADMASGKFESIAKQLNQLTPGFPNANDVVAGLKGAFTPPSIPSVEGLFGNIQAALGNPGSNLSLSDMTKSVSAQFGSLSSTVGTPLNNLMNTSINKLSDPNAPPYTGTDPIVRARLGLPPTDFT